MKWHFLRGIASIAAVGAIFVLAACDRPREASPAPPVSAPAVQLPDPPPVPSASAVLGAESSKPDDAARDRGRQQPDAKGGLTKAEESKSMPLAGQVNNHSSSADTTTGSPTPSK